MTKKIYAVIALLAIHLGAEPARADLVYQGKHYPDRTHLYYQFTWLTPIQSGGSCHVFSTSGLFEAACFRETGKHVNISEAALFYAWLRPAILAGKLSYLKSGGGLITPWDAGDPATDFKNLNGGMVASEREAPFADFVAKLRQALVAEGQRRKSISEKLAHNQLSVDTANELLTRTIQAAPARVVAEMDGDLRARIPSGRVAADGTWMPHTADRGIQACVNRFTMHSRPYSTSEALATLAAQQPFLCSAYVDFGSRRLTEAFIPGGRHATLVIGYRKNPRFRDGIEYLVRDSNSFLPEWGWNVEQCDSVMTID